MEARADICINKAKEVQKMELEEKLEEIKQREKIAIEREDGKIEVVKTEELEIIKRSETFISGTTHNNFCDNDDSARYEDVICYTVAEGSGLNSYVIESDTGQEVLSYSAIFEVSEIISAMDDSFRDPFDCDLNDFIDFDSWTGSWSDECANIIIEFDILPFSIEKDEDGENISANKMSYEEIESIEVYNVSGLEDIGKKYEKLEAKNIDLQPKENKAYFNVDEVLKQYKLYPEEGWLDDDCVKCFKTFYVSEKNGKRYEFVGMEHFNTEIYHVTIRPLDR